MRYVNNPADAQDILHDGFVVAFTRLKTLKKPESIEFWLATIMKNLSLQFLQAQDVVTILHEIPEVEDTPEFTDIIDLPTLESLIKKLPQGYQTIFRLSVLENKTHKEIAKILGIAPNSSSSQLFHAKVMMRRLVSEYRREAGLISLLLIALTTGVIWWSGTLNIKNDKALSSNSKIPSQSILIAFSSEKDTANLSKENSQTLPIQKIVNNRQIPSTIASTKQTLLSINPTDTIPGEDLMAEITRPTPEIQDSITSNPSEDIFQNIPPEDNLYTYNTDYLPSQTYYQATWSFKVGVSTGFSFKALSDTRDDYNSGPVDGITVLPGDEEDTGQSKNRRIPKRDYKDCPHNNDMPITVVASVNKSLSDIIGIETGLTYSYLHSTLERKNHTSDCRWHYIGIPLKVTVNNLSSKRFKLYATAGIQLDIPVYSSATTLSNSSVSDLPGGRFHSPAVWSVMASYGVSFNITKYVGIFIEPSLQYHFDHNFEVPNAWTDNKLGFSFPVGLRFNF